MKRLPYSLSAFALLLPIGAFAHVKWFAEETEAVRPYSLSDLPVIFAIIVSIAIILIGIYLDKRLRVPLSLGNIIERSAPYALSLASIGFGLAFLIFSYGGFIFAPNLVVEGGFGSLLLIIQAIAGLLILFGLYERLGGLLLLCLFTLGVLHFGWTEMMDTLEMVGFAFYAIIVGRPRWRIREIHVLQRFTHHIHAYGLPLLRVGTGLNLIILGFSEKIFAPALTADFLTHYNWNFMELLGFTWFSNYWFAFAAGVSEILFGVFFLLGLVTRTTMVCLAAFLVTTLYLLGPVEIVGHLPHFSIAIVLLVLGTGSRLHLVKSD